MPVDFQDEHNAVYFCFSGRDTERNSFSCRFFRKILITVTSPTQTWAPAEVTKRGIVSLCEITHHGLHEWDWKGGEDKTGVLECVRLCVLLTSGEGGLVDWQIRQQCVCV